MEPYYLPQQLPTTSTQLSLTAQQFVQQPMMIHQPGQQQQLLIDPSLTQQPQQHQVMMAGAVSGPTTTGQQASMLSVHGHLRQTLVKTSPIQRKV